MIGDNGVEFDKLVCAVRDENEGMLYPAISCLVFSKLQYQGKWYESVIVGLYASTETLEYDARYGDFDLEEAQEHCFGNILPFVGDQSLKTWTGHTGSIRSMVVIPDSFIVSCSDCFGHQTADAIIL